MAYTAIDDPEAYFQVKTYTGTGSSAALTLDGDTDMQPDLVWIKERGGTQNNIVTDAVRGTNKNLYSDSTSAEATTTDNITAFGSDGFTVAGAGNETNGSSKTYVAWCWKESATSGFDIVSFTGNATARTISHSLSAVPKFMIIRNRPDTANFLVYHGANTSAPATDGLYMNSNGATDDDAGFFNDTDPTSSVFSVGTNNNANGNTDAMIAYLFAEKQGFSHFGSYEGNGSLDGPFLALSFLPSYFFIKRTDSDGNWVIFDNKRSSTGGFNEIGYSLLADGSNAEATGTTSNDVDFLSGGIKIREDNGDLNADGATYIYAAFAKAPFVNSNGVPCNAR